MAQTWTYTAGGTTALDALRLQLADTDFSNVGDTVPRGQMTALFSDQEYQAFLNMSAGDTTIALIHALRTIARNRAIMAIAVNLGGGGEVDFTRMADQISKQADALWEWYTSVPAEAFAEVDYGAFSAGQIMWRQMLRQTP